MPKSGFGGGFASGKSAPIGFAVSIHWDGYIVDFVCLEARLVAEVDGGQHVERVGYEQKRSAWLGKHGFRVLRFWNHDVMNQTEAVMTVINEALHASVQPPS